MAADYGKAVPDRLLTKEMSALLMAPSAFRSRRKFEAVIVWPEPDFICEISAEFTDLSLVVSPTRILIGTTTLPPPLPSFTPNRVRLIVCRLVTFVRGT